VPVFFTGLGVAVIAAVLGARTAKLASRPANPDR
jgi:hypothetical protein